MSAGQDHLPAPGSAFAVSRRGYDPVQVDDYLRHLDAQLRMLAADRDAAVEQNGQLTRQVNVAWAETDRLKGQLRRLSAPPESVEGMSERLQSMLRLAQDEVAERRRRADAEATEIIARAEAEAGELPRQNEAIRRQLEHERKQLTFERNKILSDAREEADLILSRATADCDQLRATAAAETDAIRRQAGDERQTLDAQSAAKRTQVEEDFDIAMSARRAEAMATIHRNQMSSRDEANALITNARAESERKINEAQRAAEATIFAAERRVAALDALRAELASRLGDLRGVLDSALPAVAPIDERSVAPGPVPPAIPAPQTSNGSAAAPAGQPSGPEAALPNGAAPSHNGSGPSHPDTSAPAPGLPTPTNGTDHGAESAVSRSTSQASQPQIAIPRASTGSRPTQAEDDPAGAGESEGEGAPRDVPRSDTGEPAASTESTPTPRSSPEVRPSPRRRRPTPTPVGHQR
jgi:cell division septum initiation protein DivIVA